ncbi:ABC transporter ATP-binding protein [Enterococcus timonensis]|uniref:ABC transporter ATP-binding protein n=1 Tax=Enterococcus timonensis TaxID=1852364 RepID=UPI0008DB12FB|nr:ABC transporter ATP-binding protein [Enterococcus timonensis]
MARSRSVNEKPKNRRQALVRLWQYLYKFKWLLLLCLILTITSNFFALIGPLLSGYAIDAIQPGPGKVIFAKVFYYCGWMLFFYFVSSIFNYVISILMIRLSQKVVANLRKEVFEKLSQLPVGFYDKHQTGDIISRMTYDIDNINTSLSNDTVQILSSVITVIGSLIMMIIISPRLVLVFLITVPAAIFLTKFLTSRFQPLFAKRSRLLGDLNGFVEELVSGNQTIKIYHQEEHTLERFDVKNQEAVDAYYNAEYYGSMTGPSVNFINNLSLSLISVFGAVLFLQNALTLGNLSSFVLYSRKFSGPINEFANIFSDLQSALAAAERVFRLLDEPSEVQDAPDAFVFEKVSGTVEFSHVDFSYDAARPTIQDLNLTAKAGSVTAIVGPTGAGKTTIVNLLMRFYDPDAGAIFLDGHDIKKATRKSLRQAYAMVLQDTWLFTGTIWENLTYGKTSATKEEVEAACQAACCHEFIMQLPRNYDTKLDEDGGSLSQGQKQLLTIARAFLLEADLLILDEATSNVDTQTEALIAEAMKNLMIGKTSFVIAHRLSTIINADHILVVDQGRIIEQGRHQELLDQNGMYANLYAAQFEK